MLRPRPLGLGAWRMGEGKGVADHGPVFLSAASRYKQGPPRGPASCSAETAVLLDQVKRGLPVRGRVWCVRILL
jgi:hypothetical protein